MKNITLSIPDKEYPFFLKLVKSFDFIKINESNETLPAKKKFLEDLEESVREVNLIKSGKKKGTAAKDLLNEL